MRKIVEVILVTLTIVLLNGCSFSKKIDTKSIAILAKDETNSGMLVYMDKDYNILADQQCVYPYSAFVNESYVFLSEDGKEYFPYNYNKITTEKWHTEQIDGMILFYQKNLGYFSLNNDSFCYGYKGNEEECESKYVRAYYNDENYFYTTTYDDCLEIYSLNSFELIKKMEISKTGFIDIGKIDSKVCLITELGITILEDDLSLGMTYVYPIKFKELELVIGSRIFVNEENETVVYKLSFSDYALVMEHEKDESYYMEINLESHFKEYFNDGYYVAEIVEVNQ